MKINNFEVTGKLISAVAANPTLIEHMIDNIINNNTDDDEKLHILQLMLSSPEHINLERDKYVFNLTQLKFKIKEEFSKYNRCEVLDISNITVDRVDIFKQQMYVVFDIKVKKYYKTQENADKDHYDYNYEATDDYSICNEVVLEDRRLTLDKYLLFKNR